MNRKALLLFTLMLPTFSIETARANQGPNDNGTAATIAIVGGVLTSIASLTTIALNYQTYSQNSQTNEAALKKAIQDVNNGYLNSISNNDTALINNLTAQKGANPTVKKQLEQNQEKIIGLNTFCREGHADKKYFNPAAYKPEDSSTDINLPVDPAMPETPKTPTPGMFRQAAAFIAAAPILVADGVANTLPINAALHHIANTKIFKGGLLDTHQLNIGRVTALALVAGTAAVLYKTYAWYTNEDRILAQETVVELEEQQKEIAAQFAQEMQKPTLKDEDKTKLLKAYEKYMDELQEEIDEQKAIAGHGVTKRLAFGALVAATGVTGLTALVKHYLSNPIAVPAELSITPEATTDTIVA